MPETNNHSGVAIVDDEADLVKTYELLCKHKNVPVSFTALDGQDAIEKFKKASPRPGVVIIDYRLPSMSGIQVMREMLAIEPGMKVIFISGDEGSRQESLDSGASVFMKKPTSMKEITETINSLINS